MKNLKLKNLNDLVSMKRLVSCVTLATLVAAPALMSHESVEAKPPSHAPAWGYGKDKKNKKDKKDKKDKKRDNHDNDGDDDNDDNDNIGSAININGRVTSTPSSRQLVVRGDNGRTYTVTSPYSFSSEIDRGDQVRVSGRLTTNNRIAASRVELISNNDNNGTVGSAIDITGRVTSTPSSRQLVVRGDNGRTYTVTSTYSFSSEIDPGDRVRVSGRLTANNRITASRVVLAQDNVDPNDNPGNGQAVDFRGTVENDILGLAFTVRGDNGRTYRVRGTSNTRFTRGERVRVIGTVTNGIVIATSVTRL